MCRQRPQESLAVERDTKPWDSEESLAAAVNRTDNVPMVERQVEDSEKLVHQLKRQLQLDHGHARQDAPAKGSATTFIPRSAPQTTHISSKVRYVGTVGNGDT